MNYGDCRSITLSKMLRENECEISPQMIFGVGNGYDFLYWIEKSTKYPMIVTLGRNLKTEFSFLESLKIKIQKEGNTNLTADQNMEILNNILQTGKSVLINVDRYYLKYLKEEYNNYHCGHHSILIYSYQQSDNGKIYRIYDALDENIKTCSELEIKLGASSQCKPFAPDFQMFYIKDPKKNIEIDFEIVKRSIKENITNYLESEKGGLISLRRFVFEILSIREQLREEPKLKMYIKLQMNFIYSYIEEFEYTKSFYRGVYSKFLEEVKDNYGIKELEVNIGEFKELANLWREIALIIRENSKGNIETLLDTLEDNLNNICNKEEEAMMNLLQTINKY